MVSLPNYDAASAFLDDAKARGLSVATAESCTGGLIAASLAAVPGASAALERGFVTYSDEAKTEMLGVPAALIDAHGAVSREVALAMAEGALAYSRANIAVAVTGVAGPDGGSDVKPVGLVHIAAARRGGETLHEEKRYGDLGRHEIQAQTVLDALGLLRRLLD
ncbi:CinA family protein [Terricaulis silvestris]|uniref:Nicotinamide-nucleotide amidohydrolase PncC n=1 Tax=Terricaulis silvestris TaxID=2686094 RepID=A0A6I6MM92_9CAUL|nr:CinA family protein [Terricaulis silvestris]QGZ95151.1 Nicotinamide-nucleotide amidohydrolase PncC [Terricaulis silvestris]